MLRGLMLLAGMLILMQMMPTTSLTGPRKPTNVEFRAGGAKFMPGGADRRVKQVSQSNGFWPTRSGQTESGVALSDLKGRQHQAAQGVVSQKNGSASLPQHNDVPRMDAMIDY